MEMEKRHVGVVLLLTGNEEYIVQQAGSYRKIPGSTQSKEASPTRLLSCSLGHANNLPLMLRAENTDTSLGFRTCFSVKRRRRAVFERPLRFPHGQLLPSRLIFVPFLPPAELWWTKRCSSVEPNLSATALITSLPVAATATRMVVYVWSLQYTFNKTTYNK